jgi:hypothetical protein
MACVFECRDTRQSLRKEALLHFTSDLNFAAQRLPFRYFYGERFGEPAVFQRQAGLCRDRAQQVGVAGRVGLFGFLGAEPDEAQRVPA